MRNLRQWPSLVSGLHVNIHVPSELVHILHQYTSSYSRFDSDPGSMDIIHQLLDNTLLRYLQWRLFCVANLRSSTPFDEMPPLCHVFSTRSTYRHAYLYTSRKPVKEPQNFFEFVSFLYAFLTQAPASHTLLYSRAITRFVETTRPSAASGYPPAHNGYHFPGLGRIWSSHIPGTLEGWRCCMCKDRRCRRSSEIRTPYV